MGDDLKRLLSKVRQTTEGCWNFTGFLCAEGYGRIWFKGKPCQAHRVSFVLHHGTLNADDVVHHVCRNRACVNPLHLEQTSRRDNTLRGVGPSAKNRRKTCCHRGHRFDEANTYVHRNARGCRACHVERSQKHRTKKVALAEKRRLS